MPSGILYACIYIYIVYGISSSLAVLAEESKQLCRFEYLSLPCLLNADFPLISNSGPNPSCLFTYQTCSVGATDAFSSLMRVDGPSFPSVSPRLGEWGALLHCGAWLPLLTMCKTLERQTYPH